MIVPFKTPVDYFTQALDGKPENINRFYQIQKDDPQWLTYDNDLHIYPYVHAVPSMLSMGCNNKCKFCPTAKLHKGKVHFGDPEIIIPNYKNMNIHFMDENFFRNDMDVVLPLLRKYKIKWLAMSTYKETMKVIETYSEEYLYKCGLRCVEMGLENVDLMMKVDEAPYSFDEIAPYYLNMTFLPGETKETILNNAKWMRERMRSLEHPIHFNNGVWWAPGQFYYPYGRKHKDGIMLDGKYARTQPTYIPNSFLDQDMEIVDLEDVNYHSQLTYDFKLYPEKDEYNIREFISGDVKRAMWVVVGLRVEGIE